MRSLTKFAIPYSGASLFFLLQQVITALLIGHFVGLEELGIWNLSIAIVMVPLSLLAFPIARVVYAGFARMRDNRERVAELWSSGVILLCALVIPSLFGLIAVAPDLIPLLFGSQWRPAVPVIQILCVMVMSQTLLTWNEAVMDAADKPHIPMILTGLVLLAVLPSILVGSQFGIAGVAAAYCVATILFGQLPSFVLTTRELGLSGLRILGRLGGILPASGAACVAVVFLRKAMEDHGIPAEPRVVLSVIVGAVVYVSLLTLFARSVARELLKMARGLGPALRPKS